MNLVRLTEYNKVVSTRPLRVRRAELTGNLIQTGSLTRRRIPRVDFNAVAAAARPVLPLLVARWLPEGRLEGREWVARNPTRPDRHPGSFKINLVTGRWADFATSDKGGDAISLAAHLHGLSQLEAARRLAEMLGVQELSR